MRPTAAQEAGREAAASAWRMTTNSRFPAGAIAPPGAMSAKASSRWIPARRPIIPNRYRIDRMRRGRKTKIVATLGPSSSSPEQLKALFEAGADVFRINVSHTSHELLGQLHARLRALEAEEKRPICILVDL